MLEGCPQLSVWLLPADGYPCSKAKFKKRENLASRKYLKSCWHLLCSCIYVHFIIEIRQSLVVATVLWLLCPHPASLPWAELTSYRYQIKKSIRAKGLLQQNLDTERFMFISVSDKFCKEWPVSCNDVTDLNQHHETTETLLACLLSRLRIITKAEHRCEEKNDLEHFNKGNRT